MGVDPVIVGIVIVAIGTSLPELVTSITAALRDESDLCLGNVVGSNIFNGLVVLPLSSLVRPLPVPPGGQLDIFVSILLCLVLIPLFVFGKARMDRKMGCVMLAAYALYVAYRTSALL
jgi:cation:H+ antiporter